MWVKVAYWVIDFVKEVVQVAEDLFLKVHPKNRLKAHKFNRQVFEKRCKTVRYFSDTIVPRLQLKVIINYGF